jgi:hypothetical protein
MVRFLIDIREARLVELGEMPLLELLFYSPAGLHRQIQILANFIFSELIVWVDELQVSALRPRQDRQQQAVRCLAETATPSRLTTANRCNY